MRKHAPFEPIDPNTCMWELDGVPDVINPANFFENRPKGLGAGTPRNMAFPIDFADRPYNYTLTLPCERVIVVVPGNITTQLKWNLLQLRSKMAFLWELPTVQLSS